MPVGVYSKVKCDLCGKRIDPRGRAAHERSHGSISSTHKSKDNGKQFGNGVVADHTESELTLILSSSGSNALLLDDGVLRPIKKVVRL